MVFHYKLLSLLDLIFLCSICVIFIKILKIKKNSKYEHWVMSVSKEHRLIRQKPKKGQIKVIVDTFNQYNHFGGPFVNIY